VSKHLKVGISALAASLYSVSKKIPTAVFWHFPQTVRNF